MIDGREKELLLTLDNLIAYHVLNPSTIHKMLGAYILFEFDGTACKRRQASAAYLDMVMEEENEGKEDAQVNILDYVYKDERDYVLKGLRRCLEDETVEKETLIYRYIVKNSSNLWVKLEIFPISRGTRSTFFCGIFHDISESVRKSHKLELLDRELYYLNNSVPVGYHRCADKSGYPFTYISNSFLKLVGYAREEIEELFDNKFQEMIHPLDRQRLFQEGYGKEHSKCKKNKWVEYRIKCRDGYHWILHQIALFDIEACRFFQGTILDITDSYIEIAEQKQSLQSQQKEMEEKEHEDLKKVQSVNNAKSAFLSNMSHELRTPLNAIVGFSEIAENSIHDKEAVWDCLEKIRSEASHLRNLINNVLEMSQIEHGKIELHEEKCSLALTICSAIHMMQPQFREKQMKLFFDMLQMGNKKVYADSARLQEVFLNIIDNMVKFTPGQGSISISVHQLTSEKEGYGFYEFIFQDSGIGMKEEFLSHIFEQFERERNTTDSGIKGIGLGMTIVKSVLDEMQGKIYVYSEQGKGTKFVIHVMLRLQDEIGQKEIEEKEILLQENENDQKAFYGKRILLVEDNELNREVARELLEDIGFTIEIAEEGSKALEMVKESKEGYYHAILMDIQMPVMDGYQATEAIRRLARNDVVRVPIIAITANTLENDRKKAMESGMNAYISKPLDIRELCGILAEYLL